MTHDDQYDDGLDAETLIKLADEQLYAAKAGGRNQVRGASKVMSHLMFGVVALCADQLMRLLR